MSITELILRASFSSPSYSCCSSITVLFTTSPDWGSDNFSCSVISGCRRAAELSDDALIPALQSIPSSWYPTWISDWGSVGLALVNSWSRASETDFFRGEWVASVLNRVNRPSFAGLFWRSQLRMKSNPLHAWSNLAWGRVHPLIVAWEWKKGSQGRKKCSIEKLARISKRKSKWAGESHLILWGPSHCPESSLISICGEDFRKHILKWFLNLAKF